MLTWAEFRLARPDLAAEGHRLLYNFGIGLGFLATVRPDGGPRVHPICPILTDDHLYGLIVPGPLTTDAAGAPTATATAAPGRAALSGARAK
jgi:hypothetical protein